jgi:hypothetical protein
MNATELMDKTNELYKWFQGQLREINLFGDGEDEDNPDLFRSFLIYYTLARAEGLDLPNSQAYSFAICLQSALTGLEVAIEEAKEAVEKLSRCFASAQASSMKEALKVLEGRRDRLTEYMDTMKETSDA